MKFSFLLILLIAFCICTLEITNGETNLIDDAHEKPYEIHRIVVIGDVHGDPENFQKILSMSGVAMQSPENKNEVLWSPRYEAKEVELYKVHHTSLRTTLIQMGDLIDRGEDDLSVLMMASSLLDQVKQNHTKDNVVILLGNHELFNLQGHFHYVHPDSMGGFSSKTLRKDAFAPGGVFGRFLSENCTVLHFDADTVFVHAGLNEKFASMGVDALNKETMNAIIEKNYRHPVLGNSGPLWTRQMIMEASDGKCFNVKKLLTSIGAKRIVVGHTPQRSGHVGMFCDDTVIGVDVGISRWMYGNLAALELIVSSYKSPLGDQRSDVAIHEITASNKRRTETLDQYPHGPLVHEESQHPVEDYQHLQKMDSDRADL